MKSVHLTLDDELAEAVDRAARRLGETRSGFARRALRKALAEIRDGELEQRHRDGCERHPVKPGEFDVCDGERLWPKEHRAHKQLREAKRQRAMKSYAKDDEDIFESLAGEPFAERGNILELRGSVKVRAPQDFDRVRRKVRQKTAARIARNPKA